MHRGFFKMYRKLLDWEWYDDFPVFRLYMHLLLKANHADKKWRGHDIKRGQVLTSIDSLKKETGLSKQQVRTAIKKLVLTGEITNLSTNANRLITLVSYDSYQASNKPVNNQNNKPATNQQQTSNKQLTPTNEFKELKNVNELKNTTKGEVYIFKNSWLIGCRNKEDVIKCINLNINEYKNWGLDIMKYINFKAATAFEGDNESLLINLDIEIEKNKKSDADIKKAAHRPTYKDSDGISRYQDDNSEVVRDVSND